MECVADYGDQLTYMPIYNSSDSYAVPYDRVVTCSLNLPVYVGAE